MPGETNLWIVIRGGWRGEQDDFAGGLELLADHFHQFTADPLVLAGFVDCQIRQVTTVGKIREPARDTDELRPVPCSDEDIGMLKHGLKR